MSVVPQRCRYEPPWFTSAIQRLSQVGPSGLRNPPEGILRSPNGLSVDFVEFSQPSLPACVNKCCVRKYKSPLRNAINCYYIAVI